MARYNPDEIWEASAEAGGYDPDAIWGEAPASEETGFREGLATFLEGATGLGTEVDAVYRAMSEGLSYSEALKKTQGQVKQFQEDNEALSGALEWGGIAAGFLIPGGILAKSGQAISKTKQIGLAAAEGAAMGALYGAAAEDLETGERNTVTGMVAGGALGGLAGKFLIKNKEQLDAIEAEVRTRTGYGTHIWGEEGVASGAVSKARESSRPRSVETSANERTRGVAKGDGESAIIEPESKNWAKEKYEAFILGNREWMEENAGVRAARLASMAEQQMRYMDAAVAETVGEFYEDAVKLVEASPKLYEDLINIGYNTSANITGPVIPRTLENALRGAGPDSSVAKMVDVFQEVNALDLPGWTTGKKKLVDYFPRRGKGEFDPTKQALAEDYVNPMAEAKEYIDDVMQARTLASTFFKDKTDDILADLKPAYDGQSRLDAVIDMIEKTAIEQGGGGRKAQIASHNLAVGLRSTLVNARAGGDNLLANARKVASAGLLANLSNTVLNIGEGVTLPIYMNGVAAWSKTVVPAIGATINTVARQAGVKDPVFNLNWVDNAQMGLDRQFMGEVHADATSSSLKLVEKATKLAYSAMGTATVNTMGQEILGNSAIKKGQALAKKAIETGDYSKLAAHPAAKGMTQDEVRKAAQGLAGGKASNPWVQEWYAQALGLMQPVYSASMPKGFNDLPNARLFYGMLSYMNRQHNIIRNDVYMNARDVVKHGINSDKGKQAYKAAVTNGLMYTSLLGVANGIWDDARKSVFNADERDYLMGDGYVRGYDIRDINDAVMLMQESATNQLASNASSGLLNVRAKEFGGDTFNPLNVPGAELIIKGFNAGVDSAMYRDPYPLLQWGQTYVPGISQYDKWKRLQTGERFADIMYDGMFSELE